MPEHPRPWAIMVPWTVSIVLLLLFFRMVVGWPWDLISLIFGPIVILATPGMWVLALARSRARPRRDSAGGGTRYLLLAGAAGIPLGCLSVCSVFVYGFWISGAYVGAVGVGILGCGCVWMAARVLRALLAEVRGSAEDVSEE